MKREHITGLRTAGVSLTLSPPQRPTKPLLDKRGALLFQFRRRRMSQKLAPRRRAHGLEVLGRKRPRKVLRCHRDHHGRVRRTRRRGMRVERVPFPASISRRSQPTPISKRGGCFAAGGRKDAHARDFGALLRPRRERPRGRRAAEQRDEIASLHSITSSARASSVISKPSASDFFEGAIAWMRLTGEIVTSKPACFRNSAGRL